MSQATSLHHCSSVSKSQALDEEPGAKLLGSFGLKIIRSPWSRERDPFLSHPHKGWQFNFLSQPRESPPMPLPQERPGPGSSPRCSSWAGNCLVRAIRPLLVPLPTALWVLRPAENASREREGCSSTAAPWGDAFACVGDPSQQQQGPSNYVQHPARHRHQAAVAGVSARVPSSREKSLQGGLMTKATDW